MTALVWCVAALLGLTVAPTVQSDLPVTLPDPASVSPGDPQQRLDTPEAVFIADALRAGEQAIASAELARDRSEDEGVKALAERLAREHAAINDRFRKLQDAGAATEPRDAPLQAEMASLEGLDDEAFDAAWLAVEEAHHKAAIEKFERASANATLGVDLRSAAAEALTTLRGHADAVSDLRDSLGYE